MKKFLSLILALTLVASLFTINVMAAEPTVHTVTIKVDKTTELAAGDKVTVEVVLDNSLNMISADYSLAYDTDVFVADTAMVPPVPTGTPKCFDSTWYAEIKNSSANWGMFLGSPTIGIGTPGKINLAWAGSYAVMEGYNDINKVIGKFYLTVKDGVADGTTATFSLTGKTSDTGQTTAAMVCDPVTVKVGADAPAVVEPTFGATTDMGTDGVVAGGKKYDNALAVETKIAAGTNTTEIGVLFAPEAWLDGAALVADKAGVAKAAKTKNLGAGETTITAAIRNIPRIFEGKNIVMVTVPYAFDGTKYTYGAEVKTIVNFGNTGE